MKFIKDYRFALLLILILAVSVRSLPAWLYPAWGGDLGIYYGIASRILESKEIFVDYNGWGSSYNYFPVLYLISLAFHILTGVDLLTIMVRIAPIIGGLTVIIFYYIMMELTKNRKISLLSSSLLAVAPFHVYQTSHAAPLTVGHFFMLLSILFFIKYRHNIRFLPLLLLSTFILILSHHLTTYFYLISILGMITWRNFKFEIARKENLYDLTYLTVASALTFAYWRFVAKPVYYSFMKGGSHLQPWQVIILYFFVVFLSFFLANRLRGNRRICRVLSKISSKWYQKFPKILITSFVGILLLEIPFLFLEIPTAYIKMNFTAMLLSVPTVLFSSIAIAGAPCLSMKKERSFLQGWLIAITLSLLYSLITTNTTLYPYRHMEYLMVPMSASAAFGIVEIGNRVKRPNMQRLKKLFGEISVEVSVFGIAMFIILSNTLTVYPAGYSFKHLDERYSEPCFHAIEWLKNNTKNNDTIATDLRLSDFVWAYGMNATFDKTNVTWSCTDWRDCLDELRGNENYSRVTYILIDDVMRNSVVYLNVDLQVHMTNESYDKFLREPFELVYRNATLDSSGEEIHWAEVYRVNWTYIEEFEERISS